MTWSRFVGVALVLALALTACGDPEAGQRKAFSDFLQTRIIDKPGIHVPQLTPENRTAFGPYADHYGVITTFQETMNASVSPKLNAAVQGGAIRSIGDLTTRRGDIETARGTLIAMASALDGAVGEAEAARAKLAQPPDLKPVYDTAYARLVTEPAAVFREVVPVADTVFAKALGLADYLQANKAKVKVSGASVQVSDRKVQDEINAKLQSLQGDQKAMQEAQAKLQTMIYGAKERSP